MFSKIYVTVNTYVSNQILTPRPEVLSSADGADKGSILALHQKLTLQVEIKVENEW